MYTDISSSQRVLMYHERLMLTYAVSFIQNIQLFSFATVFILMALRDRDNLSLRWLAYAYLSGLAGTLIQITNHLPYTAHLLPLWIGRGLYMEAVPIGYACIHLSIIHFVHRGARTRWISLALILASLPLYLLWSGHAHAAQSSTLSDLVLSLQTALTAWLLLSTNDEETLWPRRVQGYFLIIYSTTELARVIVYLVTGQTADRVANWVEVASGIVYVISLSMMPLALIWMFNLRLVAHLGRQALSDPLTHLLNRRGLEDAGKRELARYARTKQELSLVVLDVDHFKRLNDTFGHAGGDIVLREIADLLRQLLRESDSIGRLGGDEFVLVLPDTASFGAGKIIDRVRLAVEKHPMPIWNREASITSSFGIATSNLRSNLTWDLLLKEADLALYAAKAAGRNCYAFYTENLATQEPIASQSRRRMPRSI
jgi:diguanylate cyclase (GGDEF)-like protein